MREQVSYRLSDKGQKAKIALLFCLHTSSSKLLNYHQSKATQDESRQANIPINQPLQSSQFKLVATSPCRESDKQNHSSIPATVDTQLIPGSVTNISSPALFAWQSQQSPHTGICPIFLVPTRNISTSQLFYTWTAKRVPWPVQTNHFPQTKQRCQHINLQSTFS